MENKSITLPIHMLDPVHLVAIITALLARSGENIVITISELEEMMANTPEDHAVVVDLVAKEGCTVRATTVAESEAAFAALVGPEMSGAAGVEVV